MSRLYSNSFLYILSLTVLLSACVKIQDKEAEKPPQSAAVTSSEVKDEGQVLSEGEANDYQIQLKFPSGAQAVQRYLKGESEKSTVSLPLNVHDDFFIDTKPPLGSDVVYQFGRFESGAFNVLEEREVSVPVDLVIENNLKLDTETSWGRYKRIFISEGVYIYTNGFNLQISADQLVAPQLTIQTFLTDTAAEPQQNGRSGGNVELNLKSGSGNVNFKMFGQRGGQGAKGQTIKADIILSCGSAIVPGVCGPPADEPSLASRSLFPTPQAGQVGADGMSGGDSGSIAITILEAHNLSFSHQLEPGLGGEGGDGGDGQIVARDQGQMQGARGPRGHQGSRGLFGSYCIKDQNLNFCLSR